MTYTVITPTGDEVRARWTGRVIEIVAFRAIGGYEIAWASTLEQAIQLFDRMCHCN